MESLENSLKYRLWKESLLKNKVQIQSIQELNTIHKPNGEVLFGLVKIDAVDESNRKLLPIALLRGNFVQVIVCLIDKDTQQEYFLLVKQRRIADGEIHYEHVAGMCDSDTDLWKVAIKEVEEETGLKVQKSNLKLLNDKPLYSSPGLMDEAGYFFSCELELSHDDIQKFKDRTAGADEYEFITTYLASQGELFYLLKSISSYLGTYLFFQARINRG